jgi:transcriptional regulator with XRE-family HTH domain
MLSPDITRAARALLDWNQESLAERSNLSLSTVKDFEAGRRTPAVNSLAAIQIALENAGIRFLPGDWSGGAAIARVADGNAGAVVADASWPARVRRV